MKALKIIFSMIALALVMGGCAYSFFPEEPEVPDTTDPDTAEPVSFAATIAPVFEAKCTRCHDAGRAPDLTAGNAYSSINRARYINSDDPESSLIYTKPLASHGATYSPTEAANLLLWIKQGANDN